VSTELGEDLPLPGVTVTGLPGLQRPGRATPAATNPMGLPAFADIAIFFDFQDGGRPPSWISERLNF